MIEMFVVLGLGILLGWPLGRYLAAVMQGKPMVGDRLFYWVEQPLYRVLGTSPQQAMNWRGYVTAFLVSNLILGLVTWVIFMVQAWLPLNPNNAPNMSWDLALHTMMSF